MQLGVFLISQEISYTTYIYLAFKVSLIVSIDLQLTSMRN